MMKYRIKETHITEDYSEIKIQIKILFFWFNINVNPKYECGISSATRYIKLKNKGFPVDKFIYVR